jgi:hypothetical protein
VRQSIDVRPALLALRAVPQRDNSRGLVCDDPIRQHDLAYLHAAAEPGGDPREDHRARLVLREDAGRRRGGARVPGRADARDDDPVRASEKL